GGVLAGVAGALVAPLTGLQVETLTLLIIPALAAVLVGGFASFPLTMLGALLIGVAQSEAVQYIHQPGISDSLPFIVMLIFLLFRGRALPARGFTAERLAAVGSGLLRPRLVL